MPGGAKAKDLSWRSRMFEGGRRCKQLTEYVRYGLRQRLGAVEFENQKKEKRWVGGVGRLGAITRKDDRMLWRNRSLADVTVVTKSVTCPWRLEKSRKTRCDKCLLIMITVTVDEWQFAGQLGAT